MASASCPAPLLSRIPTNKPWTRITKHGAQKVGWIHGVFQSSTASDFCSVQAKAAANNRNKPNSVICSDCDGNGAVVCSQCKGSGVNSVDFFNGQFKAGDSCWLCGGRKEMLCGNCNGAGFVGGFMSTFDE